MLNQRSDKVELLRIAEAVAVEKSIDKEIILSSMESAIQKAAKTRFGSENDIRAKIDRESGDISLHKVLTIVENPENFNNEISFKVRRTFACGGLYKIIYTSSTTSCIPIIKFLDSSNVGGHQSGNVI